MAVGAWSVTEPISGPTAFAFPGIAAAREPLAWFDSLEVSAGEGAAWSGFGASLATVAPGPAAGSPQHTRAMFHFLDGDFGLDETGLGVERGDSLRFLRAAAFSANRGPRGPLGLAGRHVWGAKGHITHGAHALEAAYNQRGEAANLQSGEEQTLAGESGRVAWRVRHGAIRAALSASRGWDAGQSFLPGRDVDAWSRRDAERNEIALEAGSTREARDAGARVSWSETRVRRSERPGFDRRAHALWAAVRLTQPAGDGMIDLAAGAGHHDVFGGWDWAPSAAYRFSGGSFRGRVVLERLLAPVWTDLRTGVEPFLQRTWVAGWELDTDASGSASGHLGMLLGSSRDRAIVERLPLEEQWLRNGLASDPGRYDFGLFTGSAAWRGKTFGASGEGVPEGVGRSPERRGRSGRPTRERGAGPAAPRRVRELRAVRTAHDRRRGGDDARAESRGSTAAPDLDRPDDRPRSARCRARVPARARLEAVRLSHERTRPARGHTAGPERRRAPRRPHPPPAARDRHRP
jgi:hypothetical protein